MFFQSVTFLFLLFSLRTNGLGTKHNYLPFVNLGSNGVPFEYLYQNGNTYETASYISPAIQIGSESFSSAYINLYGAISFQNKVRYHNQAEFSSFSQGYVIAPFWAEMFFNADGHVRYEVHNEYSPQSRNLKDTVANYIGTTLGVYPVVKSLLVVEWKGMIGYTYSRETNTFQAIIASSGSESYAIFTYQCGGMDWSNNDATIGFTASGGHYRNHPYSRDWHSQNPIACLNSPDSVWSNVVYKLGRSEPCASLQFGCSDGSCVNYGYNAQCDGVSDCSDGIDEVACNAWYTPLCRPSQYSCTGGGCVESSQKCNGRDDCADGSDEEGCSQSESDISTGAIFGISVAGVVVIVIFIVVIVTAIYRHLKHRNLRRAQFQRLRSELSIRPQPTPQPQTLRYHPKPEEWYQTYEGHWVQGPPPAYAPADQEGIPSEGGTEIELTGGFSSSSETEVLMGDSPRSTEVLMGDSPRSTGIAAPPPNIPNDQSSLIEPSATNEVVVVSDEGNSLDNSSSESSLVNDEDTPLIES